MSTTIRQLSYLLFVLLTLQFPRLAEAAAIKTQKTEMGWSLTVDGRPFFVKGLCYIPVKVGEDPNQATQRDWMVVDDDKDGRIDSPYQSWVDKNRNNKQEPDEKEVGDFALLKDLGVNVIRIYHHPSGARKIKAIHKNQPPSMLLYNHAPNKNLLSDLYRTYGIYVAMGDLLGSYGVGSGADWHTGTDYTNPTHRANMTKSVEDMVMQFKDEPYILFWILGNENNLGEYTRTNAAGKPDDYAKFVNEMARLIKSLDPTRPVCVCNGETHLLQAFAKNTPDVDIVGVNSYRKPTFGTLWDVVANAYDKPVLITEYGISHPKIINGVLDEKHQAKQLKSQYCDMVRHQAGGEDPQNAIGGFLYDWMDQWWQDGDPTGLNLDGKKWNHEMTGLAGQGHGEYSPYLRQLREGYFILQSLWNNNASCSER